MYLVKAQFLSKHATKRSLFEITIVDGDGLFDQSMVKKLCFTTAIFFADRWHMTDLPLRKTFGPVCYNMLEGHLVGMIDAGSLEQFEETLSSARSMLDSMPVKKRRS